MLSSRNRRWCGDQVGAKARAGTHRDREAPRRHRLASPSPDRRAAASPRRAFVPDSPASGRGAPPQYVAAASDGFRDNNLDQRELAFDRAGHPLDQKRTCRGRRIVDPFDRGALETRAGPDSCAAPGGFQLCALLPQPFICYVIVLIDNNRRFIGAPQGSPLWSFARRPRPEFFQTAFRLAGWSFFVVTSFLNPAALRPPCAHPILNWMAFRTSSYALSGATHLARPPTPVPVWRFASQP